MRNLLRERCVEPAVLDGDRQIICDGFEQLYVFTGKEIALYCLTQPEDRHRALLRLARNVVIQVEASDCLLRARRFPRHIMRVFEKQMTFAGLGPLHAKEAEVESAGLLHAERFRQGKLLAILSVGEKNRHAIH